MRATNVILYFLDTTLENIKNSWIDVNNGMYLTQYAANVFISPCNQYRKIIETSDI